MAKDTMRRTALTTIGYEVDYGNETIWLTREFGRLASLPENKEFKRLAKVRREYGYKVAYRTNDSKPRETYEDLTIEQMEANIQEFLLNDADAPSDALTEFNRIKESFTGKEGVYGKLKGFYVDNFKENHKAMNAQEKKTA